MESAQQLRAAPAIASIRGRVDLSIVVPVHNEAPVVDAFFSRLFAVLDSLRMSFEVICVNDGSTDASLAAILKARESRPEIKVLDLSRNFGKDIALSAGLDHAGGAAVIPIDADLQDPPELIPTLIARWREGFEVVNARRQAREGETWTKKTSAAAFYRLFSRMSEVTIPEDTGDFRLLDRKVVDALRRLPERTRFMKGLFAWVGFKQTSVYFHREARPAGTTKWNYWRLWNFALDGILSFSSVPLQVWSYLGLAISMTAFLYALFLAALKIGRGIDVPGYTSLMVVVLFLGGVQLITLGVIGEYLGRVYAEVKARPLYIVGQAFGFDDDLPDAKREGERV
ncbi:MAG TPA: glycosyltransferase family 2 protein [Candidatus Binataceae bacterium]|nr:glycosyltransferase family 2 protein [Candidatus Binataceae bacterium]